MPVHRRPQVTWSRSDSTLSPTPILNVLFLQTLRLDLVGRDFKCVKREKEGKGQSVWWEGCRFKGVKIAYKTFLLLLMHLLNYLTMEAVAC